MAKFDITAAFQAAVGTAGNVSKLDTSLADSFSENRKNRGST